MEQKCEAPQNEDDENKDGQRTDQISAAVLKEKFSRVAVPDDRQIEKKYHCGNDPNAGHGVFKIFPAQGDVGADEKRGKKPDPGLPFVPDFRGTETADHPAEQRKQSCPQITE